MAFVGVYPHFLAGKWQKWDPRIKLGGEFIEGWLEVYESYLHNCDEEFCMSCQVIRLMVWEQFQPLVKLFYPYSVML